MLVAKYATALLFPNCPSIMDSSVKSVETPTITIVNTTPNEAPITYSCPASIVNPSEQSSITEAIGIANSTGKNFCPFPRKFVTTLIGTKAFKAAAIKSPKAMYFPTSIKIHHMFLSTQKKNL